MGKGERKRGGDYGQGERKREGLWVREDEGERVMGKGRGKKGEVGRGLGRRKESAVRGSG